MINPNFVTGLAEWAGSFTFSRGKGGITLYFGIRSSVGDLTLLTKVRDYFRAGKVYRGGRGSQQWVYFRVNRLGDLIKIVAHFNQYPFQGVKQRAFLTWKDMVLCKRRKLPNDQPKLVSLSQELSKRNR